MKKREVVWLIVRLIGVYLVYMALVSVFSAIGAGSALYSLSGSQSGVRTEDAQTKNTTALMTPLPLPGMSAQQTVKEPAPAERSDTSTEKQKTEAFKNLLFYLFLTAIYGASGIYLVRNGLMMFNILSSETSVSRKESDPAVTTLDL
jgi:hypothetical protein